MNIQSRFINEIGIDNLEKDDKIKMEKHFNKEEMIDTTIEYNIGDRVHHDELGNGLVVSIDKSIITIAFEHPIGIRKFIKGHKSIRKV